MGYRTTMYHDRWRFECIEFVDCSYDDDYMWNPSKCYCECDKAHKIGEYVDVKNCSCIKTSFRQIRY